MNAHSMVRGGVALSASVLWCLASATSAVAVPSFVSTDPRLPNPDQPYRMTSGTVNFGSVPDFSVYNLEFQASNPAQLDIPTPNLDGSVEFDSFFDITYRIDVSVGLGPVYTVSGPGTAHVRGVAPAGVVGSVYEFESELLSLDLLGLSAIPETMLRESPTLASTGITRVEGGCYGVCPAVVLPMRISSFFDVFTEVTLDGVNWVPGDAALHVEQAPEPASSMLAAIVLAIMFARRPTRQAAVGNR